MAENDDFRLEEEGEDLFARVGKPSADSDRSGDLEKEKRLRDSLHQSAEAGSEKPEEESSATRFETSPVAKDSGKSRPAKTPPARTILLAVLLLAAAGAAWYFYFGMPSESSRPKRTVSAPAPQKPIAVPPRPEPAKASRETGLAEDTSPSAEMVSRTAGEKGPEPPAETVSPPKGAEATVPEEKIPSQSVASVPPPKPAPGESVPVPSRKEDGFVLEAGGFLVAKQLDAGMERVRELGFQPDVRTHREPVPMTRLLNGVFPPAQGEARLAALKKVARGAFVLRRDGGLAVFAGSFSQAENARKAAEKLREAGFRITEEQATAELPVSRIRFGMFPSREKAEEIARKAKSLGLEVEIARAR